MLAVDTNIVVRYLVEDDPVQSEKAKALIDRTAVYVSMTVLLECEWVLRSLYGLTPSFLASRLRGFAGLSNVVIETPERAMQALDWLDNGMDFADALHLAGADGCEAFISFDERFVKAANRLGALKVRAP